MSVETIESASGREVPAERWTLGAARQRWLTAGVVYSVLLVLCAAAAYWAMFSQFAQYDDEGLFDYSVKLFAAGHPLYNSVFGLYGPFYYEIFGGLFALTGHSVTTDAGRLIQLVIWLTATLGLGLSAHRLTGRLSLGVVTFTTSFALMGALTNEPMHPAALVCALLTAMTVVIAFGVRSAPRPSLVALGALAAALLLTKINVGGYAIVAIGFAVMMAGTSVGRHPLLRAVAIAVFVLVGPAVMANKLNFSWVRVYALVAFLSTLAIAFVTAPPRSATAPADESMSWVRWLVLGFLACAVPVLAIVFALGTSPGELVNQILVLPARKQSAALTIPTILSGAAVWWSLAAAVVAWTLRRSGYGPGAVPTPWGGVLRALAGIAIVLSLGDQFPFTISPNAAFALAMPLAWVAALPSPRDPPEPRVRLVRILIPSLAVLQALLAYPVAGSQLLLGSILLTVCGVICLADGWFEVAAWNATRRAGNTPAATRRETTGFGTAGFGSAGFAPGLTALFVALAVGTTFQYVVQPLQANHDVYRVAARLHIAGATQLRTPVAAQLDQVVRALRGRCRSLIELPGLFSFNLWTGLPTPSPLTGEQPYWVFLTNAQQRRVLAADRAAPGLCAIRNDGAAMFYTGGKPPPRTPLVAFVQDDFTPFAHIGPYVLEARRS